jgi:hypothetical protein
MGSLINLDAYRAAPRCLEARAGQDERTCEALERAARRYMRRALGGDAAGLETSRAPYTRDARLGGLCG